MREFLYFLFATCFSVNLWGMDAACPKGRPTFVDLKGVSVEYKKSSDRQVVANIFMGESFRGVPLYDVSFEYGDWRFTKDGDEQIAPEVSASLKIRKDQDRPFVQIFLGESKKKSSLIVQYGELCAFFMKVDLSSRKKLFRKGPGSGL